MPPTNEFPHLSWTHQGPFNALYDGGRKTPDEVVAAKADRVGHSEKIRDQFNEMAAEAKLRASQRAEEGLPEVKGKGFILRVPEDTDVDALAHALGVELVAETENGLMFAASDSLSFVKLMDVLSKFELNKSGGGSAANIVEVFHKGDDQNKLSELLVGRVHELWPLDDDTVYTFDLGIQTAASSRTVNWTRTPKRRKGQADAERSDEIARLRMEDRIRADEMWMDAADKRFEELSDFIKYYDGSVIGGPSAQDSRDTKKGIVFPDCMEVRVRMTGKGFRDLIVNFRHLFEVAFPPDVLYLPGAPETSALESKLVVNAPDKDAPRVCVVDSGIQEEHLWLAPAIDKSISRCFLPGCVPEDVGDYVAPRGHGTRVAGAVLYPRSIPKEGEVEPVAWIQNARVLDQDNHLPETLPPVTYLAEVVAHYSKTGTKIFNHSIGESKPCEVRRMCAWAAKIDDLSHRKDVLFIQISGNLATSEIFELLKDGAAHPSQLLDVGSKVASPGQSLHALTVGAVSHAVHNDGVRKSFANHVDFPVAYTRSGYSPLWKVVKPDVVEYGGDRVHETPLSPSISTRVETSPELLASTRYGQPAVSSDDVGTSFAAPKVAHIAAQIQRIFPDASPQLYRALIVQSAQWPVWALDGANADEVFRLIGYGVPSLERATTNNARRITLVTSDAKEIWSKQYHLYQVTIPEEIRGAALEGSVRVEVTLAYTSTPRRTRSRRTGYLETWLDWRVNGQGESVEHFRERMEGQSDRRYPELPWAIHQMPQHGEVDSSRSFGTIQKDWAVIPAHDLPSEFAVAVRGHVGWNHKPGGGLARYCLVVSFEALDAELPVYSAVEASIRSEAQPEVEV